MSGFEAARAATRAAGDHDLGDEFDALGEAVRYAGDHLARALWSRGLHPVGVELITQSIDADLARLATIARRSI